ncbi:MAG: cytochrome c4 [Burkholderiales bacterium]|nr:cytochrome c4 [Burkholderiales bacterium]
MSAFKSVTAVLILLAAATAHAESVKGDPAKGQALSAACMACHGPDGNSALSMNPSLAQQHPAYITKQLADFKSGERANPIMAGMAAALSAEDMKHLGAYFGAQKLRPAPAHDGDLAAKGQKLYRAGDANRGLPACAACHSPTGAGIPAQYPRLAGQYTEYTIAQLKAFRAGERANDNASMMRTIAARMTDDEMAAVAEYLAGLR